MLPTPSTSHVDSDRIYEPAEDSYLLLDTLASANETEFLTNRFSDQASENVPNLPPLIVEVGTGSGIVLAFVTAHARAILGRDDVLAIGTDVNVFACRAAEQTILQACKDTNISQHAATSASPSTIICADLTNPLRSGVADVLIFNPPYVPSDIAPGVRPVNIAEVPLSHAETAKHTVESFEHSSYLLSLSYAGGFDGMEVTNKLLDELPCVLDRHRGVAYILLCQQNRPEEVVQKIRNWGEEWAVEIVGRSGKMAGWEKLAIVRIWRTPLRIMVG